MKLGESDTVPMWPHQRPRPSTEALIRWGCAGTILALCVYGLVNSFDGGLPLDRIRQLNAWWLGKVGHAASRRDAGTMLALQIIGVGFVSGVVIRYFLPRQRANR